MKRTFFSEMLEGRRIIIHTQRTQTIKICTAANSPREYERYYRIPASSALDDERLKSEIKRLKTLAELYGFIEKSLNGRREPEREQSASSLRSNYMPERDSELETIKNAVEGAIDALILEFTRFPYLHRVEHSIHAQLFYIMMRNPCLSRHVFMGDDKTKTLLVHKEWPWPYMDSIEKRGNFDFAVLTPEYLRKDCPNIDLFRKSYFCPPIIIEIGLDYGYRHLHEDHKKLSRYLKQGSFGYLIHLERERTKNAQTEKLIETAGAGGIKTAYALIVDGKIRYKAVNDPGIREEMRHGR